MKKILFVLIAGTMISLSALAQKSAQTFKPFKFDISMGYAMPAGSGSKGGVLFALEPKYAVMQRLSVGLRWEGAIIARFSGGYDQDGMPMNAAVKLSSSYCLTGDYYLTDNYNLRPFAGAGAGFFLLAGEETNGGSGGVSAGSKFGGLVRAGIEISHFRVGLEYNIVPKTTFTGWDSNGDPVTGMSSKNSYLGIKIGCVIGGGPR